MIWPVLFDSHKKRLNSQLAQFHSKQPQVKASLTWHFDQHSQKLRQKHTLEPSIYHNPSGERMLSVTLMALLEVTSRLAPCAWPARRLLAVARG